MDSFLINNNVFLDANRVFIYSIKIVYLANQIANNALILQLVLYQMKVISFYNHLRLSAHVQLVPIRHQIKYVKLVI